MKDADNSAGGATGFQRAMFIVSDAVLGAAILIMLGVWGGGFLDDKLHSSPWCSLGLSILGGGLGLWRMVKKATSLDTKGVPPKAKPIPYDDDKDDLTDKSDS